jgi:hypothetical protein
MRRIRFIVLAFIISLSASGFAQAQQSQEKPQFPKNLEGFLSEVSQLMKKYPLAAQTFSLRDNSNNPNKPQVAHHACCEWSCEWDHVRCTCVEQCLK